MPRSSVERLRSDSVLIVDGSFLLHRSMHLPGAESGPSGYPTGAMQQCMLSLCSWVRVLQPNRVFWVHDKDKHPARLVLYPDYKKKCPKNEQEQQELEHYREVYLYQRDRLLQVLPLFGAHVIHGPYESDDTICYLASLLASYNVPSVILTEDKDFGQLLRPLISVMAVNHEALITNENWKEWSTWAPHEVVLAKSILGDASDNIPSACPGLGEVGLRKVLDVITAQTLEAVVSAIKEKFPQKKYQGLLEERQQQQVLLNRRLVDLASGLAFSTDEEKIVVWSECQKRAEHHRQELLELLSALEMRKVIDGYGFWSHHFEVLT